MRARLRAIMAAGVVIAGSAVAVLAQAPAASAQVPGANGRIAFVSNRHNGYDEIWTMAADGSDPIRLTFDGAPDADPAWSPDGAKIAFNHYPLDSGGYRIRVMNADGSGQVDVGPGTLPSWTPDGRISYSLDGMVHVIRPDGTGAATVTAGAGATWSPDGTRLAVVRSNPQTNNGDLWRVNADGSGAVRLRTSANLVSYFSPQWSPDGTKIAYVKDFVDLSTEVHVMNVDGTGDVNLTPFLNGQTIDLAWSPDGTKIVYDSTETGEDIWTMNAADGSGKTDLTVGGGANTSPDWQPVRALRPEVVHGAKVFTAGVADGLTMTCPAGKVPVSAGGFIGVANGEVKLTETTITDTNGVRVSAAPDQGYTGEYQIDVMAVCAVRPPGYQIVRSPAVPATGTTVTATAVCPTGTTALAGGARITGATGDASIAVSGVPRLTGPGDRHGRVEAVAALDRDAAAASWSLQATAICAFPVPAVRQISQTSPVNSESKQAVVYCDADEKMLSASGEVTVPPAARTGDVILDDVSPTIDLTEGIVTAIEDPDIAGDPLAWSVTAYATCMSA